MKPLRILIANNTLSILAGSETFARTLAIQLKKLGHIVEGFSPELGIISDQLEKEGIRCFNQISISGVKPFSIVLEERHDFDYDVIIASHNHIVDFLRQEFPKTPIISTIHGIIHLLEDGVSMAPEHPALNSGVNQFVAVSEEVQEKLKKDYNIDSLVIRNFFDLESLSDLWSKRKISEKPKQFLVNSNYILKDDEEIKLIKEVAKHYDAKVAAIGVNFASAIDLGPAINDSDIVVGMGRSVLEGVAAGRLGIVHGRWGTAGVIHEGNIDEIRRYNFSGRNSGGKYLTAEELISQIDQFYNEKTIEWGKNYIQKEHNVVLATEMFVQIARDLLGENINKLEEIPMKKYRRAEDVK